MKRSRIKIKDLGKKKLTLSEMRRLTGGSEWKYVNIQRYFSYAEPSISNGTSWNLYNSGKG